MPICTARHSTIPNSRSTVVCTAARPSTSTSSSGHGRRAALGLTSAAVLIVFTRSDKAFARPVINNEVDAASSTVIQEMLRKTEEMREQRKKERLDAYNKKNFKEYFDYELGPGSSSNISEETKAAMRQWLLANQ